MNSFFQHAPVGMFQTKSSPARNLPFKDKPITGHHVQHHKKIG